MAKIDIPASFTPFIADQADTTYVLNFGNSIISGTTIGIDANAAAENRTFQIDGTVVASLYGITVNHFSTPMDNNQVLIGETGVVDAGKYGVTVDSDGGSIINDGVIATTEFNGYAMGGEGVGMLMENNGTLSGYSGFAFQGTGGMVINNGTVVASNQGVVFLSADGDKNTLVNSGNVAAANGYAVYGNGGEEKIVNSGHMAGDILLRGGDDTYISKGGTSQGFVYGGDGDDTFIVDQRGIKIGENQAEGFDRLRSSVSITLADNVEEAMLTGKKNINLVGTGKVDLLYGNSGDNRIVGGLGADYITGGKGDDWLTGGDGTSVGDAGDIFIFKAHSGDDLVIDFQDGTDLIALGGYDGIDSFADVSLRQVGDDVRIKLLDGDSITIRNFEKADLTALDFDF